MVNQLSANKQTEKQKICIVGTGAAAVGTGAAAECE